MGFVKSLDEIADNQMEIVEIFDAEVLTVFFMTKPEIVQRLLPPPLEPAAMPVGFVFVANYPRTSFGVTYLESSLFLQAEFNGEQGAYCLSMPVTNDIALILGREALGYPKKMGNIGLTRQGKDVEGWTERRGVRFLDVRAKLTGKFNSEVFQEAIQETAQSDADLIMYNHKYFQAPTMKGFDYNPRLVKEVVKACRKTVEMGEAELVFQSSDHDPWGDVEIVQVLGATYSISNIAMLPGAVVAEVDQIAFAPYAFMKLDTLQSTTILETRV
ncbi:MAG: acetoacetate decarboxylase family protein [Chloroflexota bacterium]|nr:acetoacetate decarboxylase family protein [Chloroflexota bacterium]